MVVSLTLTPMMCAYLLKDAAPSKPTDENSFFARLTHGYAISLQWVLRRQRATLLVTLATLIITIVLYIISPKGFLPSEDTGQIIATTDASQTVSFAEMSRLQHAVSAIAMADPAVESVASFIGVSDINTTPNSGRMSIMLKDRDHRANAEKVMARLNHQFASITGISVHLQVAQDIQISTRISRTQYQYTLTDLNSQTLETWTSKLISKMKNMATFTDVASDQQPGGLKVNITIDRDQASRLGISAEVIDNTLYSAFGQRQISTVYAQVNQYRVILEVSPETLQTPQTLETLRIKSTSGALVPLGAFARVSTVAAPLAIMRQGQFPSITVSFNLAPGASLGEAIDTIHRLERELSMPNSIASEFSGDAAEFRKSLANQPLLMLTAIIAIYIVLGVLYESAAHPITILSTLPSAGVGALLALLITGHDLSIIGIVGIILLMGIVKKNAIMMIDFALMAEREHHLSPAEAIYQACLLRFRPIMMTTMAALLGALPLAFDQGIGAELRRPLGICIVGGLIVSQLLTLYTTPVIYLAMERLRQRFRVGP